jgi:hypothetical protein
MQTSITETVMAQRRLLDSGGSVMARPCHATRGPVPVAGTPPAGGAHTPGEHAHSGRALAY